MEFNVLLDGALLKAIYVNHYKGSLLYPGLSCLDCNSLRKGHSILALTYFVGFVKFY